MLGVERGSYKIVFDLLTGSDDEVEPFEKLARKMEDMTGDGGVLKVVSR